MTFRRYCLRTRRRLSCTRSNRNIYARMRTQRESINRRWPILCSASWACPYFILITLAFIRRRTRTSIISVTFGGASVISWESTRSKLNLFDPFARSAKRRFNECARRGEKRSVPDRAGPPGATRSSLSNTEPR